MNLQDEHDLFISIPHAIIFYRCKHDAAMCIKYCTQCNDAFTGIGQGYNRALRSFAVGGVRRSYRQASVYRLYILPLLVCSVLPENENIGRPGSLFS